MAAITSARPEEQGPYSQPHAPSVSKREEMGDDGEESHRTGAPERAAPPHTSRSDRGRNPPALEQLPEPYNTLVLVAPCLGLRVSEIVGLQWGDFDWENMTVLVQRAVVQCRVGETKTETSSRPLPIHPGLAERLLELRARSKYCEAEDWVLANDAGKPRWQETILERQLKPAALRAGIGKVGWHTFRHTYSTMLRSAGTDIKVQQELLRHANIQTTMNIYTQAVSEQKRAANSKVVEMVLSGAKKGRFRESGRMGAEREPIAILLPLRNWLQVIERELLGLVAGGGFEPPTFGL